MTSNIIELPDYPRIKKLAAALYRFDASHHGAAIMIGAGFSRSAAHHVDGQKKMPLWDQFTKSLIRDLYPAEQDLSFADPLRVAEEFRAYYGQAALNDRIRVEINNETWRAGPLYRSLLKLPWSEVLTTNWDTLLEQAATELTGPYYTAVTKTSDLAWAQSPRIVKLHGTIGVTDTFIAAQEDYRTYPERFASFVNFARQVFIENELCLLGFSGDDPNFLQWAGWVRDHLAGHARKIYLVGALKLSAARRKQLESINVAPIDLWPLVANISDPDLRHQRACELFLEVITNEAKSRARPHEWTPTDLHRSQSSHEDFTRMYQDPTYGASLLAGQLDALRRDRESYPGWLLCPPSLRRALGHQIISPLPSLKLLEALSQEDRARLLYEIAWRCSITFSGFEKWLGKAFLELVDPDQTCVLDARQQLEIALLLLKETRWFLDDNEDEQRDADGYEQRLIDILKKHAEYLPDCAAEIAYHHALMALDRLDYNALTAVVAGVAGDDPIWRLRQASLLMELGRSVEALSAIEQAYGELREKHRRDRHSIAILSRLLWAHWLLRAVRRSDFSQEFEELPASAESTYRIWKCDPSLWLDDLAGQLDSRQEKYLESQRAIEPMFIQGHYRDRSESRSESSGLSEFWQFDGLSRTVGIPLRMDRGGFAVSLLSEHAQKLIFSGGSGYELTDLTLAIRCAHSEDSKIVKVVFTRIGIACASERTVNTLTARLQAAIEYWREERLHTSTDREGKALTTLRVLVEVLSRLAVRVSTAKAKELFQLAVSMGRQRQTQHMWLSQAIDDLLTHSLRSIPDSEQGELLPLALDFPLQKEVGLERVHSWPNPIIKDLDERCDYPNIDERIKQLIAAVASAGGDAKHPAILRLLPLSKKSGFLTVQERDALATAIWGTSPNYEALPDTGLFPHVLRLLPLPSSDAARANALVLSHLYEHGADVLERTRKKQHSFPSLEIGVAVSIYKGMAGATTDEATRVFPSSAQAQRLFDQLIQWRPPTFPEGDVDPFGGQQQERLAKSIGEALSYAIAPVLSDEDRSSFRLDQLLSFCSDIDAALSAVPALAYFTQANEQSSRTIAKFIQRALRSRDSERVNFAGIALRRWMDLPSSVHSLEFRSLVSTVVAIIESGRTIGLLQLLWLVTELFENQRLSEEHCKTLVEVIPTVFEAMNYAEIDPRGREAVVASLTRAACAKLAQALQGQFPEDSGLEELVKRAKTDPLPEVRFELSL